MKSPHIKNLSDNFRSYLTIGAYIVLLHYLWFWGDDRKPGWVFQGTAIIWGICILWFFFLAIAQTWHLYFGFCFELLTLFLKPYAKHRKGEVGKYEHLIIEILREMPLKPLPESEAPALQCDKRLPRGGHPEMPAAIRGYFAAPDHPSVLRRYRLRHSTSATRELVTP